MSGFKKHKFKHFSLSLVGKADKNLDLPSEYIWRKIRFKIFEQHLKEVLKGNQKLVKTMKGISKDELNMFEIFDKRAENQYEPNFAKIGSDKYLKAMKEQYENMTEEEQDKMADVKEFIETFAGLFKTFSEEKIKLTQSLEEHMDKSVEDCTNEAKAGHKSKSEYENTLINVSSLRKTIEKLEKDLEKSEKKTQKQSKIKNKQKGKKHEEGIIKKIVERKEEMEKLKKDAMVCEQTTLDELEYQVERTNNDYLHSLRKVILDYKEYHQSCLDAIQKVVEELGVEEEVENFLPSKRKEKTIIQRIRPCFKPTIETKVFEVDIDDVMKRKNEEGELPTGVELMFDYLENCLELKGIFRKPGNNEQLDYLQRHMNEGKITNLDEIANEHTIASMLKQYIRTLPTSICEFDAFMEVFKHDEDEYIKAIQEAIKKMSQGKQMCLYRLLKLLHSISKKSDVNLMTSNNLSLVWSMNLMRAETDDPMAMIEITPKISSICETMIDNFPDIFPTKPEVFYEKEKDEDDGIEYAEGVKDFAIKKDSKMGENHEIDVDEKKIPQEQVTEQETDETEKETENDDVVY